MGREIVTFAQLISTGTVYPNIFPKSANLYEYVQ